MYKIEYLPIAKSDMEEIIYYISQELKNTKAALDLINEFRKQEKNILTFPYGSSICQTIKPLKYEYRKVSASNFHIFYVIDENKKIITISRVLYQKRNIEEMLK